MSEVKDPAAGVTPPQKAPKEYRLRSAVTGAVSTLQAQALGQRGEALQTRARARLSVLRRSAGLTPEKHPVAWQEVLDAMDPPLSADEIGTGDAPSRSETAAFTALTLFALHMQSQNRPMHVPGRSFGSAMRRLRAARASESIKPRFDALLAARDDRSRLVHARTLISLLRSEEIGFDYGIFAEDLSRLQSAARQGVLLRWGRDFAIAPRSDREPADAGPDAAPATASDAAPDPQGGPAADASATTAPTSA